MLITLNIKSDADVSVAIRMMLEWRDGVIDRRDRNETEMSFLASLFVPQGKLEYGRKKLARELKDPDSPISRALAGLEYAEQKMHSRVLGGRYVTQGGKKVWRSYADEILPDAWIETTIEQKYQDGQVRELTKKVAKPVPAGQLDDGIALIDRALQGGPAGVRRREEVRRARVATTLRQYFAGEITLEEAYGDCYAAGSVPQVIEESMLKRVGTAQAGTLEDTMKKLRFEIYSDENDRPYGEGLIPVWMPVPLHRLFSRKDVIWRGAYGGRGSGKSYAFAAMAVVRAIQLRQQGKSGLIMCLRAYQNSLRESSMADIKSAISDLGLSAYFHVSELKVTTADGQIAFDFRGAQTPDSLKSTSAVLLVWIEEAEAVPEVSWQKLEPTVRTDGAEIWASWNPEDRGSPVDTRYRGEPDEHTAVVAVNWQDNPMLPDILRIQRERDKERYSDALYRWIWEGDYLAISEASVLFGKTEIADLDEDTEDWDEYYGADFGYSADPATLVRVRMDGNGRDTLYISHEAYQRRVTTPNLPHLYSAVPGFDSNTIWADSSRPDTIRELCDMGLDVQGAEKGANSVLEGVHWLLGFRRIVIHPRCVHAIDEAGKWRWKIDRKTSEILHDLVDKDNHIWDAVRYATREYMVNGTVW